MKIVTQKKLKWDEMIKTVEEDLWCRPCQMIVKRVGMEVPIKPSENIVEQILLFPARAESIEEDIKLDGDPSPFIAEEVKMAGTKLRNRTIPGVDGVRPEVIKIITYENNSE